jgi:hypothetical protein
VVETILHVGAECVFAGVTARAMAAVVAERDRFGEGLVEAEGASNGDGDLGNFEGVSEAGALMVFRKNEDLGLSCKAAKRTGVEDAITIAFEAGAERIGLFIDCAISRTERAGGKWRELLVLDGLATFAIDDLVRAGTGPRIAMCETNPSLVFVPMHGAGPRDCAALVGARVGR